MPWQVLVTAPAMYALGQAGMDLLLHAGCQITKAPSAKGETRLASLLPGHQAVIAGSENYPASLLHAPERVLVNICGRRIPGASRFGRWCR